MRVTGWVAARDVNQLYIGVLTSQDDIIGVNVLYIHVLTSQDDIIRVATCTNGLVQQLFSEGAGQRQGKMRARARLGCCQCMTPRIHVAPRDSDNCRRTRQTALAVVTFALALPTLLVALATDLDSESIMGTTVRYACMACQSGGCSADSYFTTYQQAASHYANSARCNQSLRGIATVVLPSRSTDVEAGGSGAAEAWSGPPRRGGPVRRQRLSAGALRGYIMPLHHKKKHDFRNSLYHKNHDFRNSLYHGFCLYPIGFHGFWEISGVPRSLEHYDIML